MMGNFPDGCENIFFLIIALFAQKRNYIFIIPQQGHHINEKIFRFWNESIVFVFLCWKSGLPDPKSCVPERSESWIATRFPSGTNPCFYEKPDIKTQNADKKRKKFIQ